MEALFYLAHSGSCPCGAMQRDTSFQRFVTIAGTLCCAEHSLLSQGDFYLRQSRSISRFSPSSSAFCQFCVYDHYKLVHVTICDNCEHM